MAGAARRVEVFAHAASSAHPTTWPGEDEHQESPARFEAIRDAALAAKSAARVDAFEPATREALLRVHSERYLDLLETVTAEAVARPRKRALSPLVRSRIFGEAVEDDAAGGTPFSETTFEAARYAAGAAVAAVDAAARSASADGYRAFVCSRPPGHHAMRDGLDPRAGGCGFCVVSTVAVAAAHALARDAAARVAVVDFDVHHGNGTQAWAEAAASDRLLFASVHCHETFEDSDLDFFPGTGGAEAVEGVANFPVAPNWRRRGARNRFKAAAKKLAAALRAFEPTILLISAGFDAGRGDVGQEKPADIAGDEYDGVGLEPADYGEITATILRALPSRRVPVVSCLEGGYGSYAPPGHDRADLASGVRAHVDALAAG